MSLPYNHFTFECTFTHTVDINMLISRIKQNNQLESTVLFFNRYIFAKILFTNISSTDTIRYWERVVYDFQKQIRFMK